MSDSVPAERPVALPLREAARLAGHYAWLEMRLFEVLGGWVPAVAELEAKLMLGSQCHHHAWHAELWRRRLPVLAGTDHDELIVPANGDLAAFVHALAEPVATIEKLVGVYRVLLPQLLATYMSHLARASTVTDGPTIRALKLVLADETDDRQQGELVVRSLLSTPDEVSRAAVHHRRLEGLLLVAGGIAGPTPAGW